MKVPFLYAFKSITEARRALQRESKAFSSQMVEIDVSGMQHHDGAPIKAWRSRDFLAQLFTESGQLRLSINRSNIDAKGEWTDGIGWDDLQRIKSECGFGDRMAVEIYPQEDRVVNVANIRHLWILDAPLSFAWKRA